MKLSHSKLSLLLNNPMEYYLSYRMGITPKFEKPALSIGSATHWGIEHDTEDLTDYFGDRDNYGRDQLLAEAMVHGYRFHKNQIFDELLTDTDGSKMQLIQETHELFINGKLKSFKYPEPHIFVGIIDLLLLTDKGFIIVDYKTSSMIPDWDNYLDQLYRYIFLIESEFPGVPVKKIAIINLKKSRAKATRGENNTSFLNRLKKDYEINDDSSVNWHIFDPHDLDKKFIDLYIDNLSRMADTAQSIDINNMWFINWSSTNSYGGSVYKNIIYHVPDCYVLYNIKDEIYDEYSKEVKKIRDCKPIDMEVIDKSNILNKYSAFEANALSLFSVTENVDKDTLFTYLKKNFICDDDLLEKYWITLLYKMQSI
mgnify:CR=1 FL=1